MARPECFRRCHISSVIGCFCTDGKTSPAISVQEPQRYSISSPGVGYSHNTNSDGTPPPLAGSSTALFQSSEELLKFRPDNAMLITFLQQALTRHDTTKVCIGLQSLQNGTIQRFAGQSRFLIAETPAILLFFASNHVCERELISTSCAGSKLICGIR